MNSIKLKNRILDWIIEQNMRLRKGTFYITDKEYYNNSAGGFPLLS